MIGLADHSVFAFKDLLMMMISLFSKKLLFCYFSNCFSAIKRRDLPTSILAVGVMFAHIYIFLDIYVYLKVIVEGFSSSIVVLWLLFWSPHFPWKGKTKPEDLLFIFLNFMASIFLVMCFVSTPLKWNSCLNIWTSIVQ